ncbi:hypothetical protein HY379_00315 [Candidatus Saccharibacteria bacterium]|nr:hypothetical protein [Candidatus Saccharibacteria bacterium]
MAKNRPRRSSPLRLAGAFELFGQSYRVIRRNFDVFMVLFSVGALLALWETLGRFVEDEPPRNWKEFVFRRIFGGSADTGVFAAGGFMFIVTILYGLVTLLIAIAVLRAAQGHKISLGGLWRELTDRWLWLKLIGSFILLGLSVIAGLILLIVPGIILLWRLFLVQFVLIDQKTSIKEAFRRSWRMTKGYPGAIYGVIAVSILLSITDILPVFGPLIAFALTSIYTVAPALRYQELKKLS